MTRILGVAGLALLAGCLVPRDDIRFDDVRVDTGGTSAETDCLRWRPDLVNLVGGVTELTVQLTTVCDFPVQAWAVSLDDPDSAFATNADSLGFPREVGPGETIDVQVRFVATDGAAHEGQLLCEMDSFDAEAVVAVAQLYGEAAE